MERSHLWRWICVFLTIGSWLFLLFAVASFHPTDWPSHAVGVYAPVENLCGAVGAVVGGLFIARPALVWRLIRLVPAGAVARIFIARAISALRAKQP